MFEKRGYVRHMTQGSIKLKAEKGAQSASLCGDLLDISSKGFSVCLEEDIELGSAVEFELIIGPTTEKVFKGQGKVINVKEVKKSIIPNFRIGIEFVDFNKDEILEMMHLIFVHKNR